MPPEIRDRAFEPFFTTKEKGRGTGLGLAMVYGFVKQSGGHIAIQSEIGHGTTLNLYFPCANEAKAAPQPTEPKAGVEVLPRATILVVEDDERVRRLTVTRLKLIGYQVIEARSGAEAIEILDGSDPIDLVFTDIVMPGGLSGWDVAGRALEVRPGIKVLLTSGYAEDTAPTDDALSRSLKVLRKPYHQADLTAAVQEALTSAGSEPHSH
jgi:CheY-like chemotaxis protein